LKKIGWVDLAPLGRGVGLRRERQPNGVGCEGFAVSVSRTVWGKK